MKNIFKTFIAATLIAGFASCEEDQNLQYLTPEGSFMIVTPQSGETVELSPTTPDNPALVLAWEDMDYTTPTAVTYTVEVAPAGTEFTEPMALATTTNTYISINSATLNQAALDMFLPPFTQSGMDVRIKSSIGTMGEQPAYSNVITYMVTPFSNEMPKMAVVGNHQGWNPGAEDVPLLASPGFGETNYEGYVWLDGEYKFILPNAMGEFAWPDAGGGPNYGAGGEAGTLAESGPNLTATPGYYLVRANTGLLTYNATLTNWGVIGSATAAITGGDGWGSDIDMTYDPVARTWSLTVELGAGEIKFRANDDWGLNYGDNDADSSLEEGGANIAVGGGNYTITLDLSNPRAYTYTVQQN